jgi:predicted transcriptional regulator
VNNDPGNSRTTAGGAGECVNAAKDVFVARQWAKRASISEWMAEDRATGKQLTWHHFYR